MALSVEQKIDMLIKNFDILSRNLVEKDGACADLIKKVLEYSPERAFDLWVRLLNDEYSQNSDSIISLYEEMDKVLPEKMINFILSKSQASKNFILSEHFQIGGSTVFSILRWGPSLHNGVIFLINSKDFKKLSDYLNFLFSLNKAEKLKANLLKATLYLGSYGRASFVKEVYEIFEHYISKLNESQNELEVYHAYIYNLIDSKKYEFAMKFWVQSFKIEGFSENKDLIELTEKFDTDEPNKLAASILKNENLFKILLESKHFKIDFISNSLANLFNVKNNKRANEFLRLIFIQCTNKNMLKDFLIFMIDKKIKQLDDEGLEVLTGYIETFSDEEFNAELTTALIKFM